MSADKTKSVVAWFEIPAGNYARAVAFNERVLDVTPKTEKMGRTNWRCSRMRRERTCRMHAFGRG